MPGAGTFAPCLRGPPAAWAGSREPGRRRRGRRGASGRTGAWRSPRPSGCKAKPGQSCRYRGDGSRQGPHPAGHRVLLAALAWAGHWWWCLGVLHSLIWALGYVWVGLGTPHWCRCPLSRTGHPHCFWLPPGADVLRALGCSPARSPCTSGGFWARAFPAGAQTHRNPRRHPPSADGAPRPALPRGQRPRLTGGTGWGVCAWLSLELCSRPHGSSNPPRTCCGTSGRWPSLAAASTPRSSSTAS